MSDIESTDWSVVAANNNQSPPAGAPEGWAPSSVNNWGRECMGAIKRQWNRAGPTVTAGGTANAITLTYTNATVAALVRGQTYAFIASATNTGATTLKVDSLAATAIRYGNAALMGGEIIAGQTYVVMYDGTAYQLISPPSNAGLRPAFNYLINGGMEVWQRGAGGAASIAVSTSTSTFTADRWALTTPVATHTISQQAGLTNGSQWCARVQRNAGQTDVGVVSFEHPFTLDQIVPLRGQIVKVLVTLRAGANFSPTSSVVSCTLAVGTGAARIRGTSAFTSETSPINSANFTTSSSVTQFSSISTVVIPTTTTQATLSFFWTPTGTAGAADYFEIDDVALVVGAGATTIFDRLGFGEDLARCERFYQKSFPYATAPAQNAGVTGGFNVALGTGVTGTNGGQIPFRPRMYQTPGTVTTYNPSATNANVRDTTNNADRTITVGTKSDYGVPFTFASGAAASINVVHWAADAELT